MYIYIYRVYLEAAAFDREEEPNQHITAQQVDTLKFRDVKLCRLLGIEMPSKLWLK